MITMDPHTDVDEAPVSHVWQPLTVAQVRAMFPEWEESPTYNDAFCQGLAEYVFRMDLHMENGCLEVAPTVRYSPGPDGQEIVGRLAYMITLRGLETLAQRAGILEGQHQVTESGPLVATVRVHVPMPDGSLRPVDASAAYEDWYYRHVDVPPPSDGSLAPVIPGRWTDDPEGALIRVARGLAYKKALGEALEGHCTDVDLTFTERHRVSTAYRAQAAVLIAKLRARGFGALKVGVS